MDKYSCKDVIENKREKYLYTLEDLKWDKTH
jgi:hypothetical protein